MRSLKELYIPSNVDKFLSHMALYCEPTGTLFRNAIGKNNQYNTTTELSPFIFNDDVIKRKIKYAESLPGKNCPMCNYNLQSSYDWWYRSDTWHIDKVRHEYPNAWGHSQSFLSGKKVDIAEFVERHRDKFNSDKRELLLQKSWDEIGLYDVSYYLIPLLGFEEEIDRWLTLCMKLRYQIMMKSGIDVKNITYVHPAHHFTKLVKPAGIDMKTLAISISKDATLVNEINSMNNTNDLNFMKSCDDANVNLSDDSIDFRDIFIDIKPDAIREVYKFFENEHVFDSKPSYIASKFKSYHEINLGLLEDAKI